MEKPEAVVEYNKYMGGVDYVFTRARASILLARLSINITQ